MKPENISTLVITSWMGVYFGIVGCLIGFMAMGMPLWMVAIGIFVAAGLAMFGAYRQMSKLYPAERGHDY